MDAFAPIDKEVSSSLYDIVSPFFDQGHQILYFSESSPTIDKQLNFGMCTHGGYKSHDVRNMQAFAKKYPELSINIQYTIEDSRIKDTPYAPAHLPIDISPVKIRNIPGSEETYLSEITFSRRIYEEIKEHLGREFNRRIREVRKNAPLVKLEDLDDETAEVIVQRERFRRVGWYDQAFFIREDLKRTGLEIIDGSIKDGAKTKEIRDISKAIRLEYQKNIVMSILENLELAIGDNLLIATKVWHEAWLRYQLSDIPNVKLDMKLIPASTLAHHDYDHIKHIELDHSGGDPSYPAQDALLIPQLKHDKAAHIRWIKEDFMEAHNKLKHLKVPSMVIARTEEKSMLGELYVAQ